VGTFHILVYYPDMEYSQMPTPREEPSKGRGLKCG
jgi:hypothetical protein